MYHTVWSNGEVTWETRDCFIDGAHDGVGHRKRICEALVKFEANEL